MRLFLLRIWTRLMSSVSADRSAGILNSSRPQTHILVGLDYYLARRDTYPNTHNSWKQMVGIVGGIAADAPNTFFLGAAFEPMLGIQFSIGGHFGIEKAVQQPYVLGRDAPGGDVPTYDKRSAQVFFSGGFDLQIFRKLFGKITGVGAASSGQAGGK